MDILASSAEEAEISISYPFLMMNSKCYGPSSPLLVNCPSDTNKSVNREGSR